jgi:hypothetical protein
LEQLLDRNLSEVLQELRVAFTVYVVALLSTALATMVLTAPVSFHRIVFRRGQKAALVVVADRLLIVGLACSSRRSAAVSC